MRPKKRSTSLSLMATKMTSIFILIIAVFFLSACSTSKAWDNSPPDCPYPCLPAPKSVNCPPPPPPAEPVPGYPPPPPGSGYFYPPPPGYFPYNPPPYISFPAPPPPNPILPWFPWYYKTPPPPASSAAAGNPSVKARLSLLCMVSLSAAVGFLVF